ncbi:hypothetical protein [Streptomyces sp. NPDC019224]|uniref:hypothetical protein n=1 Tax=Streptomyces sp. NPDC019224 TaxID=3154484 RepID=UPI0033CAB586
MAGDPCMDQLRACLPFRERYRRALGLHPGQQLVVVSSTWGEGSLLGSSQADVLRRTLAELPVEEFRVLAAIHPNAYYGHGAWQLQSWLAPLMDSGLILPNPESDTWKAALCAADFLVGDHGSLTMYGTSLGIPCILGAFEESKVAPDSPMDGLGRILPRISSAHPLRPQLYAARTQKNNPALRAVGQTVTSEPGRSAELLRRLFYTWLRLDEPEYPATSAAVPVPAGPSVDRTGRTPYEEAMFVTAFLRSGSQGPTDGEVTVCRYPAARQRGQGRHLSSAHLAADRDDPVRAWPRAADVLLIPHERIPRPDNDQWHTYEASVAGCGMVAAETTDQGCLASLRDGRKVRVTWLHRPPWATFALAASAAYAWNTRVHATETVHNGSSERVTVRAGDIPEEGVLEMVDVREPSRL